MKRPLIIHPFLFAIYPIIALFSFNVDYVFPEEIILPLFFVITITFVIWIVLGYLLKSRIKSGFIVSIGLVLFFSYGYIYILFDELESDSDFPHLFIIIPVLFLLALGSYFFIRTKKSLNNPTKIVNVIAVSLVVMSFFGSGEYYITESFSQNEIDTESKKIHKLIDTESKKIHKSIDTETGAVSFQTKKLPDVYYIIFDGYPGSKSLQTILNFDNSELTDFLKNKGFYISSESYSNYLRTDLSLASTLNMEYVNYIAKSKGKDAIHKELIKLSHDNEVIKNFKSMGYTTYAIEAATIATREMENIDFRLCKQDAIQSEFGTMLIHTTILNPIQVELFSGTHRDKTFCGLYELKKMANRNESPKFVLAHFIIPHYPYVFDSNGDDPRLSKTLTLGDVDSKYYTKELFLGQLEFTNLVMKESILELMEIDDPPIIIIESDHGMRTHDPSISGEYETNLDIFNNFKAYYFPGVGQNIEFETTTPVNSFRVLFNLYFGYEYDLLEDKIYYNGKTYKFREVTETLIKN